MSRLVAAILSVALASSSIGAGAPIGQWMPSPCPEVGSAMPMPVLCSAIEDSNPVGQVVQQKDETRVRWLADHILLLMWSWSSYAMPVPALARMNMPRRLLR